ncbi:lactosylceramide 4-alpha-galactosyltransferase-like isoform X2 [Thrips palmi]|uniref:Lactosylceramide 4-alpha-galactosyltransferase-like isoform X2 n=1 Tax=Thrips palmi TaxID=161013 RepID=A0A6P8Z0U1_THRPL|nr:lactosylceramide 4-alpha-galactosyltransferase-like isoform X2 [Thrips palmi]
MMNGKIFIMGHRSIWLFIILASVLTLITFCLSSLDSTLWYKIFQMNMGLQTGHAAPITCYDSTTNEIEDISDVPPEKEDNIFFHETSCSSAAGDGDFVFTPRQACAVESAAKANPNAEVNVLFLSPIRLKDSSKTKNLAVQALLTYPNIRFKHVNLEHYVKNTPLEEWYKSQALKKSLWPTSHASDVMRYLTLWKYSGTYLDLDVVVLKSLHKLKNCAGAESPRALGAGVINLDSSNIGRTMAASFLHELRNTFSGTSWGYNGPGVITRVLQRTCHVKKVQDMTSEHCGGFTVHPPSAFYPVSFEAWEDYFNANKSEITMKMHTDSYTAHLSNKFSVRKNVIVGSRQPYALIAAQHCPEVYATCTSVF